MTAVFWISAIGVIYPYLGYPLLLWVLGRLLHRRPRHNGQVELPSVSLVIPVYNEGARIAQKLANTRALRYPDGKLQILFVSDGSTDDTLARISEALTPGMTLIELPRRGGKAAALNAGLARADRDILVFSDASIELEPDSLEHLVRGFQDPRVGCISGEDRIHESGGEALYGRFELALRRLESAVHSIAGASGSFYAQRRVLCQPFVEGLAPDFLSVLRTVEQGYRAISEPQAVGVMTSVKDPRREFERKVRTLIRGMTTLGAYAHLLNPFRSGLFAFVLLSHKGMRWLAPVFLIGVFVGSAVSWRSPIYATAFVLQCACYAAALAAFWQLGRVHLTLLGRVTLYFASVNAAILVAWMQYLRGVRQELWTPSQR